MRKKGKKGVFKFVFGIFIVWQLVINLLAFAGPKFLLSQERFMYNEKDKSFIFLWNRANFDGAHYLGISRYGYGLHQQAFFPFYPKLISRLSQIFGGNNLLAALFISNASFLLALFIFYRLVNLDFDESTAKRSLIFFLLFPTAFFLGMAYSEGLFLLLILACFYAARKQKWFLAGILGGLASYTRVIGIFLFPALIWEWYQEYKNKSYKLKIKNFLPLLLAPSGLLFFMRSLWLKYGDPLMFIHTQPFFGAERSGGKIILLYQVFWRYIKMILTTRRDVLYLSVWLECLSAILFLFLIVLAYKKKIRASYLIFAVFAYLLPTLSGTFSSLPRYVLAIFPCFIILGLIKSRALRVFLYSIFGLGLIVYSLLFFQGYWVS